MVTLVRPEQPKNAEPPMLVTEFGMVTLVRPEQPSNAELPMVVTEFGMVTLVRPEQPENARSAIPKVPSCKEILVFAGIVPLYLNANLSA